MEKTEGPDGLNEVVLRGRVSGDPVERTLPTGSTLVSFRVVLPRQRTTMTAGSKAVSDWIECSAWGARVRQQAARWRAGDQVEVRGSLRRRFFRAAGQSRSSVEVEVLAGRLLRRADGSGRESRRAETG